MAELAILADIQRIVYPEEVTRQLHVVAQARESSPVIDRYSNVLMNHYYAKKAISFGNAGIPSLRRNLAHSTK